MLPVAIASLYRTVENGGLSMARHKILDATELSKRRLARLVSKTKITCPDCGLNVWAKPYCNISCNDCQSVMTTAETRELDRQEYPDPSELADLTVKARDAMRADKAFVEKSKARRLESGRHLLDLRNLIEADPKLLINYDSWWAYFDDYYVKARLCSRKDAEKRMALALTPQ